MMSLSSLTPYHKRNQESIIGLNKINHMNYYESQIKKLQELIEDSTSLLEAIKSLMKDGKFITAYIILDDKLGRSLIGIKSRVESIQGNMRLDNKRSEPIRSIIIDELISNPSKEDDDIIGEYSRDYLSDLTDIELVKRFHEVFGTKNLHMLLKQSSTSNQ